MKYYRVQYVDLKSDKGFKDFASFSNKRDLVRFIRNFKKTHGHGYGFRVLNKSETYSESLSFGRL